MIRSTGPWPLLRLLVPLLSAFHPIPLGAQLITTFTVSGSTVTFPSPTGTQFQTGIVNAAQPLGFTVSHGALTVLLTSCAEVTVQSLSPTFGPVAPVGNVEWRLPGGPWTPLSVTPVRVGLRATVGRLLNPPSLNWSDTLEFRVRITREGTPPGTFVLPVDIRLRLGLVLLANCT